MGDIVQTSKVVTHAVLVHAEGLHSDKVVTHAVLNHIEGLHASKVITHAVVFTFAPEPVVNITN